MRILVLSVALLCPSPLLANDNVATTTATTTTAVQTNAEGAEESKPAKICKRIEPAVGRVGAKKICLTSEQWKKRQSEEM